MSAKTSAPNVEKPSAENNNKVTKSIMGAKSFYNKHFPTERKTYNLRLPFWGFILSILAADFIKTFILPYYFRESENDLAKYAYVLAAAGVSYELYYGLKIGDRKQYTPWILLKIAEIILIFIAIIVGFCDNSHYLDRVATNLVYGFIVFFFNIFVLVMVLKKSHCELCGPQINDENIYDNYYEDA